MIAYGVVGYENPVDFQIPASAKDFGVHQRDFLERQQATDVEQGGAREQGFRTGAPEDTSAPTIALDIPGRAGVAPYKVEGPGSEAQQALGQYSSTEENLSPYSTSRELRAAPKIPDTGPDRLHYHYHVVLGEKRGNNEANYRTVPVSTTPTLIVQKDEDRRVGYLWIATATTDGSFIAIGRREIVSTIGLTWSPTSGMPPLANALLIPTTNPTFVFKFEHVQDIWAVFVPNGNTPVGLTAIVTCVTEIGDRSLAQQSEVPVGFEGDR